MNRFHQLKVQNIRSVTLDAVEIKFDIPENIKQEFRFKAGQYITIRHEIDGEDIRRSYSLCSSPNQGEVSIGVKRIVDGKMSTFLTESLNTGDILSVMPPSGNFILEGENVVGICAGSGITPILSMIKSYPKNFTLIYGNKSEGSTMFLDEIKEMDIQTYFAYSQEPVEGSFKGRIDSDMLGKIADKNKFLESDHYFICGPGQMIENTEKFLLGRGVSSDRIHFEKFVTVDIEDNNIEDNNEFMSNVKVIIDGDEFDYQLSSKGDTILDSAMDQGADLPFSCKGAVCCTCKAKVMEGEARMSQNFSLSEKEVKEGYILSCQAHPITKEIIVDFDEM